MPNQRDKNRSSSDTKNIHDITFESFLNLTNKVDNKITNTQNMHLSNLEILGCSFNATQVTSSELNQLQEIDNETKNELINDITDKIQEQLSQKYDGKSGFLSTSAGVEVKNKMRTELTNIMKSKIDIEKTNKLIGKLTNKQDIQAHHMTIDPCGIRVADKLGIARVDSYNACKDDNGKLPDCNFGQDMIVSVVAQQVASDITEGIQTNKNYSDLIKRLDSATTSEKTGIGGAFAKMFDSIFGGMSGPFKYGMIASVICCVVLIISITFLGRTAAGQNAIRTGVSKL